MNESKRIRKLREDLIKKLPRFPNDKATKVELENQSLGNLLIHYLNWAFRYVAITPRKVAIEPEVTRDKRWAASKAGIEALLEKVRKGEELTPHLSLRAHSRGYTASKSKIISSVERWEDKDFVLNTMGYYHFHLGLDIGPGGFISRTDNVLFARVTRELFTAVALFDHTVFESQEGQISPERNRLWEIFDRRTMSGVPSGTVVISSMIATSGHSSRLVGIAQDYAWTIAQIDPKLASYEFLKDLYFDAGLDVPRRPKLEWWINFTDLGLFDKNHEIYFVLRRGFN